MTKEIKSRMAELEKKQRERTDLNVTVHNAANFFTQ
eukprot:SAG31_NODE_12197_length_959_cov_2.088372_1_plen_36_part_00